MSQINVGAAIVAVTFDFEYTSYVPYFLTVFILICYNNIHIVLFHSQFFVSYSEFGYGQFDLIRIRPKGSDPDPQHCLEGMLVLQCC